MKFHLSPRFCSALRWLTPNGGTLLLTILFLLTQNVLAHSGQETASVSANIVGGNAATMAYQGRLMNEQGNPLNGSVDLVFALYNTATGGTPIWGPEPHEDVPVSDGMFNVGLGSHIPGGIPNGVWDSDKDIYLEIMVNGETLSPRETIRNVLIPDGSIHSSHLALDSGEVCLSESVDISLPGSWTAVPVPGLALSFTLEHPSKVLIWMNGLSLFDDSAAGANYVELVVDGVSQIANHSNFDMQWDDVKGQRIFDLSTGSHELFVQGRAKYSGIMAVHGNDQWKTCIYYLVLGEQ